MAFVHGRESRLFLGDKHVSGVVSGYTCSFDASLAETTNLLSGGSTFIPGLTNGELSFEGMIETVATPPAVTIQEAIRTASQTDSGALMTAAPSGLTIGRPAFFCKADISGFEIESSVEDAVTFSVESQGDEGIDWGHILHDHTAVTATANGTSHDNLAGTANGGAALLHVTAASGTTPNVVVKVQHSTDDSIFTDLITFTAATASTSEFKTLAAGTTVNRYVRAQYTITGTTPSFTFVLAFARR